MYLHHSALHFLSPISSRWSLRVLVAVTPTLFVRLIYSLVICFVVSALYIHLRSRSRAQSLINEIIVLHSHILVVSEKPLSMSEYDEVLYNRQNLKQDPQGRSKARLMYYDAPLQEGSLKLDNGWIGCRCTYG